MEVDIQKHLIDRCKKNDRLAQMELYDRYCKAMFNTAYNFTKKDDIAQDIMQEAFIKAFKKIDSYNGEASFGAWLKRIVINQSLDWLKKQKLPMAELPDHLPNMVDEDQWEIESNISMSAICKSIEELPQKCRNVVKLYLLEGL